MDGLRDVVFEDGRDVFLDRQHFLLIFTILTTGGSYLWKVSLGITDQQTCFATAPVTHHDKLLRIGGWLRNVGVLRHLAAGHAGVGASRPIAHSDTLAATTSVSRRHRGWGSDERVATRGRIILVVIHGS